MSAFSRTDTSVLGRWWWTVDRWMLVAIGLLIGTGALLILAASPSVAERIGYDSFYFVRRHLMYLPLALAVLIGLSLMPPRWIRRFAVIGFSLAMLALVATFFVGAEVKGAQRWLNLGLLSLQPSEFVKPTFAILAAWLFAAHRTGEIPQGNWLSAVLFLFVTGLLALQPDVGMAFVVAAVWFAQFFMAGLALYWAVLLIGGGLAALIGAYFFLPHVTSRIDRFLDPASGDSYQIDRSMEAFSNGGLFGRGPGEGTIKEALPDAHSDFVFAVAGEEFGLIVCLLIVGLFAFVVLRGCVRLLPENSLFVLLAASGLIIQFGLQAVINMASSLHLMPTKGMTLPFISYGGSSLLAVSITIGMLLALTRKRYGQEAMV